MKVLIQALVLSMIALSGVGPARADLFSTYELTGNTFSVPSSAYTVSGGLIHYFEGDTLYRQDGMNATTFSPVGHFGSGLSVNGFPAFVEFSPDGSRVAIGNSGGADFATYQVAVFDASELSGANPDLAASASIYAASHSSAVWADNRYLLLTAGVFGQPSEVTSLDTCSPTGAPSNNPVIQNIGGASAGVALDAAGNLFTGNGFDGAGASNTGWIKAIGAGAWQNNPPVDFEASVNSLFVIDLLSANSLRFDAEGNLLVGGGDFGTGDLNYFGLVSGAALNALLLNGTPIDPNDPNHLRIFDPSAGGSNFYTLAVDPNNNTFYALDGGTAYQYAAIPEPSTWLLLVCGGLLLAWRVRLRTVAALCETYVRVAQRRAAAGRNGGHRPPLQNRTLYLGLLASACLAWAGPVRAENFYAEEVVNFSPGAGVTEGVDFGITSRILGGPRGGGADQAGLDVLSLGETGSVTLGFAGKWIEDGPGFDFIVFENPFIVGGNPNTIFAELAFVEVSTDGSNFARFGSLSLNAGPIGPFGTLDPALVSGVAGTGPVLANVDSNSINPFDPAVAGGNAFDLESLSGHALVTGGLVNLSQIRFLRLVDIKGDGLTLDGSGNPIYDATGFSNSADIDAVAVIHGIPEPANVTLMLAGLMVLGVFLGQVKRRS